jgi:hypothetical protein
MFSCFFGIVLTKDKLFDHLLRFKILCFQIRLRRLRRLGVTESGELGCV